MKKETTIYFKRSLAVLVFGGAALMLMPAFNSAAGAQNAGKTEK